MPLHMLYDKCRYTCYMINAVTHGIYMINAVTHGLYDKFELSFNIYTAYGVG